MLSGKVGSELHINGVRVKIVKVTAGGRVRLAVDVPQSEPERGVAAAPPKYQRVAVN